MKIKPKSAATLILKQNCVRKIPLFIIMFFSKQLIVLLFGVF